MRPLGWFNTLAQIRFDLDNDEARTEHITRVIILLMGGTILLFAPIVLLVIYSGPESFDYYGLVILACMLCCVVAARVLIHFDRWKLARHIPVVLFLSLGFLGVQIYNIGTTFLLFFVLSVLLAGIYYSKRVQLVILIVIITGINLISWSLEKDLELTLTAGITFSGLIIGVWLLQLLNQNLLQKSLHHQKELTAQLRLEVEERLKAEQKMAETNISLEKRVRERTSQLQAANEELQAVGYSIAHDLRAPIRAIIGLNEMIISEHSDLIDPEILGYLEKTIDASNRMDSMLNGLLKLLSISDTDLAVSELDLSAMAHEIFTSLTENLSPATITFAAHPTPTVSGDPELVIELLTQLISNAIKFSGQEHLVEIDFGAVGPSDQPVYYLKDNGIGINMEYAARVFDPFISLSQEEQTPGNGIGLTIARRIVELHQGKIWLESEEGMGSTFYFTL